MSDSSAHVSESAEDTLPAAESEAAEAIESAGAAEETPDAAPPAADAEPLAAADPAGSEAKVDVSSLQRALEQGLPVDGRVIGWNLGGFHVVVDGVTAFCPKSEMELGHARKPESYLDQVFHFKVLKIQKKGRRVVLSRSAMLREAIARRKDAAMERLRPGTELTGRVASITDFGAFVDLGGVQGLVHVSEISRTRVDDPHQALTVGQEVRVKVLKVERGGKRISLSMKALEPDPWDQLADRIAVGSVVQGTVERTASFGAFVRLAPGLTGLLPTSMMNLPRGASPSRAFSPGKELSVQILSVDRRRRRISLAPEGSSVEGSRADYERYLKGQKQLESEGFHALAAALQKLREGRK